MNRPSGRAADQLRPIRITRHYTKHAEGSVLVEFGDTKVICTVSAEAVNKIAPQLKVTSALPGTAWIEEGGNHQLAQAQLETSPGNNLQMTLTDWGKPVTVNKPDVQ